MKLPLINISKPAPENEGGFTYRVETVPPGGAKYMEHPSHQQRRVLEEWLNRKLSEGLELVSLSYPIAVFKVKE